MDEIVRQATIVLRGMWKHRWLGLLTAWIIGAIGVVTVLRIPDKYEASARIYVDTQSVLKPLMSGLAIQANIDQQVMILSRTLISRPNVEKLVRMADLDLNIKSKAAHEELVDDLMKQLAIKTTSRDNLYTLAYSDQKPEQAKKVVQSLVSIFVESGLGSNRNDAVIAKKFIDDQILIYQKKLEEAENRLKVFKLKHISLQSSDEGRDYFGRVSQLVSALEQAKLELREAENSRDAIKRQVVGEDPTLLPDDSESVAGVSVPELDGRIDVLKRNLDELLRRYTDQHPDVVGTRRLITQLEEEKREKVTAQKQMGLSNPGTSINTNPVYQQLRISLAESEANVASLRARVGEYQSRYNQLKGAMNMVPQMETELTQLNRDYEINKKNYDALVERRESAAMSGEMDATSAGVDFRLIDPPRVSPKPVYPNRLLMLPLTMLLALAAGVFASFAANQFRPVFFDSRSLGEISGLALLGNISRKVNEEEIRHEKKDVRRFFTGLGLLLGSYGAGIALMSFFLFHTA